MRVLLLVVAILAILATANALTIPTSFPGSLDGSIVWVKKLAALTATGPGQLDNLCQHWNTALTNAANFPAAKALICHNAFTGTPARNYWQQLSYGNTHASVSSLGGWTISTTPKPVWAFAGPLGRYVRIAANPGLLFDNGLYQNTGVGPSTEQITTFSSNFPAFSDDTSVIGVAATTANAMANTAVFNGCHDNGLAHATNTCNNWNSNIGTLFGTNGNGNALNTPFGQTFTGKGWIISTNSGQCDQLDRFIYCYWAPTANDATRNGDETGVDCGGTTRNTNTGAFAPSCASGAGDPQIIGIQGQDFQVHGIPDEFFNLVSYPNLQVNSRFVYLTEGECPDNFTTCWSHAGTYVDLVGILIGKEQVKIQAGSVKKGLRVWINNKEVTPSTHSHKLKIGSVVFGHKREVVVNSPLLSLTFQNSDRFMNFVAHLHDSKLRQLGAKRVKLADSESFHPEVPLHGLLGGTWRNVEYSSGLEYEGTIRDYQIQDGNLFSTAFTFNKYIVKH